jgi:signal transduction histidine kinase
MTDAPITPAEPAPEDCAASREDFAFFAHELRGALTVISGYSDILRRELSAAEKTAALDGIRRAVNRADELCTEVLSGRTGRVRSGESRTSVDLSALAENVAAEQRAATGRVVLVDSQGAITVTGDEQSLARVLANLVTNAAKYSPDSTDIELRVVREPSKPPRAVIEVSDRGPGIPESERERVFDPFERLERDGAKPGSGLGLAIVREIVVGHGGTVEIADRDGGGTTVRMRLPLA